MFTGATTFGAVSSAPSAVPRLSLSSLFSVRRFACPQQEKASPSPSLRLLVPFFPPLLQLLILLLVVLFFFCFVCLPRTRTVVDSSRRPSGLALVTRLRFSPWPAAAMEHNLAVMQSAAGPETHWEDLFVVLRGGPGSLTLTLCGWLAEGGPRQRHGAVMAVHGFSARFSGLTSLRAARWFAAHAPP